MSGFVMPEPTAPPAYSSPYPPQQGGPPLYQQNTLPYPPSPGYPPQIQNSFLSQPSQSGYQSQTPPYPCYPPSQPGYPSQQPSQPGYPPQQPSQPGYPPQQQAQSGYPPQQQGYPPQLHVYPNQQQGYPPQQQGYPPQQQGYPSQQQSYPPQQQGYPTQQQGNPPQQQGYLYSQQSHASPPQDPSKHESSRSAGSKICLADDKKHKSGAFDQHNQNHGYPNQEGQGLPKQDKKGLNDLAQFSQTVLKRISFRCVGSGGVVDLPGEKEDTEVLVYGDQHGGDNQAFDWDTRVGDITSGVDRHMVLKMTDDGRVVLGTREGEARECWILGPCGVLDDIESGAIYCGPICSRVNKLIALTDRKGKLVVEQIRDECPYQTWEIVRAEAEEGAKPATSCHLKYPLPAEVDKSSFWQLECSVLVRSSSPATYFCVVGWGPADYSGIQQVDLGRKVAIFSMWNSADNKVTLVSKGVKVEIDDFGGEGTGLKSMRDLEWAEGEVVTFQVSGTEDKDGWICSCHIVHRGETHFMASYIRTGPRPLDRNGFYSFVEDWDRSSGAEGHNICRKAEFMEQKLVIDDRGLRLKTATFTKVENGRDKFAKKKARGGKEGKGFFLSSGGQDDHIQSECKHGVCFAI